MFLFSVFNWPSVPVSVTGINARVRNSRTSDWKNRFYAQTHRGRAELLVLRWLLTLSRSLLFPWLSPTQNKLRLSLHSPTETPSPPPPHCSAESLKGFSSLKNECCSAISPHSHTCLISSEAGLISYSCYKYLQRYSQYLLMRLMYVHNCTLWNIKHTH